MLNVDFPCFKQNLRVREDRAVYRQLEDSPLSLSTDFLATSCKTSSLVCRFSVHAIYCVNGYIASCHEILPTLLYHHDCI